MVSAHYLATPEQLIDYRAQRLTASMVSAPLSEVTSNPGNSCSTPYGINGFGTGLADPASGALRQCSTPYGINGFGT